MGYDGESLTSVKARRYKKRLALWAESFTLAQALEAVVLLEICGVDEGRRREMWAYVFKAGNQIGYITLGQDDRRDGLGNGTFGSSDG